MPGEGINVRLIGGRARGEERPEDEAVYHTLKNGQ